MDLSEIALILLEYQDDANRLAIKDLVVKDFVLEYEDSFAWDDLLAGSAYRPDLAGNHYGRMFFSNRHLGRLRKMGPPRGARRAGGGPRFRRLRGGGGVLPPFPRHLEQPAEFGEFRELWAP